MESPTDSSKLHHEFMSTTLLFHANIAAALINKPPKQLWARSFLAPDEPRWIHPGVSVERTHSIEPGDTHCSTNRMTRGYVAWQVGRSANKANAPTVRNDFR